MPANSDSKRVLEVKRLNVEIPVPTGLLLPVQDVSLHVDRGETLCVVGESGCGKSLTSLAIMDLLPTMRTVHAMKCACRATMCSISANGPCRIFAVIA